MFTAFEIHSCSFSRDYIQEREAKKPKRLKPLNQLGCIVDAAQSMQSFLSWGFRQFLLLCVIHKIQ